ncbi:MAG: PTS sugar transporter subunit IIA [Candidatus Latescibacterota bacterium]
MTLGIIVAHGNLGEAAMHALKGMYGEVERLESLSNEGLSTEELAEKIRVLSGAAGESGICLFVDAFGGSCWRAAKMARLPRSALVNGFNLPMLLSFVNKRNTVPFGELPSIMETDGKRAITMEIFSL